MRILAAFTIKLNILLTFTLLKPIENRLKLIENRLKPIKNRLKLIQNRLKPVETDRNNFN